MSSPEHSSQPSFRDATVADADLLLQFMCDYYAFDGHAFEEPRARTAVLNLLSEPAYGRVWLILDGSTPVGYIVLCFGYSLEYLGRDAFIDELFIVESHRGRGWGRKVLAFVEDKARQEKVRCIHLEVVRSNIGAAELYRKTDYVKHDHFLMSKWIERNFAKPGSGQRKVSDPNE